MNTEIRRNIFTYSLYKNNKLIKNKLKPQTKILIAMFLIAIASVAIWRTNFLASSGGFNLFFESLKNIFKPFQTSTYLQEKNLWVLSLKFLWLSFKVTFLGTVLGTVFALFTALIGNIKTNNKIQSYVIRFIILFFRSFPELIYLYFFTTSLSGEISSVLLISWFSWIWLHKFISEAIENVPSNIYKRLIKLGYSKTHILFRYIYPSIKNKIIIFSLYSFESNLRWTSVFSTLGVVGIGQLLNYANESIYKMHELLIPLLVFVIFISILEWFSYITNNYLLIAKSKKVTQENFFKINKNKKNKTIGIIFILVVLIISTIFMLFSIKNIHFYPNALKSIFNDLINPNWNIVTQNDNIFLIILDLFLEIYITIVLVIILTYINLRLTNQKTNNLFSMHIFRFISTFIRIVPTIVIFFTIGIIFKRPAAAFVISFAIHSSTVISKQLNESISKIEDKNINNLIRQGWSQGRIFRSYILPYIKNNSSTFLILEVEKNIRNFINYGLFGASNFGLAMVYSQRSSYRDITPYVWISVFLIMITNIYFNYLKNKKINLKHKKIKFSQI
ncbi:ABC transporter permease subunit [Mycoplasma zalophi]|uniref:ABC transporter permease subunit n=1 Tax=Mycoplasma zalophi TaxID=191287 RepID=UPI001C0FE56D|nr:ABC transporter permease subunit [Mycoplasma zalophi]MBU4690970.1 ABC transporter permease subunit [Mycoplasma zalophi]